MPNDTGAKPDQGPSRRRFLQSLGRWTLGGLLGAVGVRLFTRNLGQRTAPACGDAAVWQIDPFKCVQCGRCATYCVLDVSAVKCVHDFQMCGYCDLCTGFFKADPFNRDTGAENQLCPTGAITRRFVEEPYFEYEINEDRCLGCARCVKGCTAFGNGSLHLQVRQDRCLNCNECSIAEGCPADAFVRLPAKSPYFLKHQGPRPSEQSSHI